MQLKEGDIISCVISGCGVPEALVAREAGGKFFLLQDVADGCCMIGREKYPYEYSYVVGDGSDRCLEAEYVRSVKVLKRKKKMNHEPEGA